MIKTLKGLTILLILILICSGCAGTPTYYQPFCLEEGPLLEDITVEEQKQIRRISADLLRRVGENDMKQKLYIKEIGQLAEAHNGQFKTQCSEEVS